MATNKTYWAIVKNGVIDKLYQTGDIPSWGTMGPPMGEYLSASQNSANATMAVYLTDHGPNTPPATLQQYTGYGTDPDEMIAAGRYRLVWTGTY